MYKLIRTDNKNKVHKQGGMVVSFSGGRGLISNSYEPINKVITCRYSAKVSTIFFLSVVVLLKFCDSEITKRNVIFPFTCYRKNTR